MLTAAILAVIVLDLNMGKGGEEIRKEVESATEGGLVGRHRMERQRLPDSKRGGRNWRWWLGRPESPYPDDTGGWSLHINDLCTCFCCQIIGYFYHNPSMFVKRIAPILLFLKMVQISKAAHVIKYFFLIFFWVSHGRPSNPAIVQP